MSNFQNKYLKYKLKYQKLQQQQKIIQKKQKGGMMGGPWQIFFNLIVQKIKNQLYYE